MYKRILSVLLIFVLAASCCGCGKKKGVTQTTAPREVDMLSIFSYKSDTFCPIASNNETNLRMLGIIYDSLITLGDDFLPQPAIAESWQSSAGNTEWNVRLRTDVKWHDGGECVAGDVVYTVKQIQKLENSPYKYNVSSIADVTQVDKYNVKFTLSRPVANFVSLLYFPVIKTGADTIDTESFRPNGTGAYRFEDHSEGNIYYLIRNDSWWGGKAATDKIRLRMLPGGDTPLYAFDTGAIDMIPVDGMDWGKFVDPAGADYIQVPTPIYTFVGINHKNPQLAMPELRRAISMVIDRDEMIDKACMGYGSPTNSPMRPEWYMCKNQVFDHSTKPESAKKILEEKGWQLKDGVYKKTEEGVEYTASFKILVNEENAVRENVTWIVSRNLEQFGIKAVVEKVDFEEYTKRISEGNYDAYVGSMVLSPDLDFSGMVGSGNMFGFEDEEMQFVMNDMQSKGTQAEVKASYAEFLNLFEQLNPVVGLYFENSLLLYSKQIEGNVLPSYYDAYRGIEGLTKIVEK